MFVSFLLVALVGAMTAAAFPFELEARDDEGTNTTDGATYFKVSNLQVAALTLSHRVLYDFDVCIASTKSCVTCDWLDTSTTETLTNVTKHPCGNGTDTAFSWTQFIDGSARLDIMRQRTPGTLMVVQHDVGKNETTIEGEGEFAHQVYIGPENFTARATATVGSIS